MSLQRKEPLRRSTPLQATKSLGRAVMLRRSSTGLTRSSSIAPQSEKRKVQMVERRPLHDTVRERQGSRCAWPRCTANWDDLHEVHTRARGGDITDERIIIGLCRHHNGLAGDDPRSAECLGVVVPSWAAANDLVAAMAVAAQLRARLNARDPQPCPWRHPDKDCSSPDPEQRFRCELLGGAPTDT